MDKFRPSHLLIGLLALGSIAVAAPVMAAARTTTSWIALGQTPGGSTSAPALGTLVVFDSAAPNNVKNVRIDLSCYQSGQLVYEETGSADQTTQQQLTGYPGFILGGGGSIWKTNGGPAACRANLFSYSVKSGVQTYNVLASTTFDAAG